MTVTGSSGAYSPPEMPEELSKTLILFCRKDFCRILDRLLRTEGVRDFQHGALSLVDGSSMEAEIGNPAEVFVVTADAQRADHLVGVLKACPVQGKTKALFELYTVGDLSSER